MAKTATKSQVLLGDDEVYSDGNYEPVTDVRFPADGEPTDFLLDVDGNEVRKGDWLQIIDVKHKWHEEIVKVGNLFPESNPVERGRVYQGDRPGFGGEVKGAWSPTNSCNSIGIVHAANTYTGIKPDRVRKVNLSEEATLRLELMARYRSQARLIEQIGTLEGKRAALDVEIRRLQSALEVVSS